MLGIVREGPPSPVDAQREPKVWRMLEVEGKEEDMDLQLLVVCSGLFETTKSDFGRKMH